MMKKIKSEFLSRRSPSENPSRDFLPSVGIIKKKKKKIIKIKKTTIIKKKKKKQTRVGTRNQLCKRSLSSIKMQVSMIGADPDEFLLVKTFPVKYALNNGLVGFNWHLSFVCNVGKNERLFKYVVTCHYAER